MKPFNNDRAAPYTHAPTSVERTMREVMLALLPATAFGLYLFGWPAILLFAVTLAACVLVEALCAAAAGRPLRATLGDGSALLTGWLLALSLPPWAPWWIGVLGAVFAIALAKHAFGGLGQNIFNPAMVARVALLISFPVAMTAWVAPQPLFSADAPGFAEALAITFGGHGIDAMSSATALGHVKTELARGLALDEAIAAVPAATERALGWQAGSAGETSALLLLAGGLFLIARRIVSWHIPAAALATVFALATVAHALDPQRFADGMFHVLCGATVLGAFFIATDPVTSAVSRRGQLVFGIGFGLFVWLIRSFSAYPEGVAFAVLLMNSLTPTIDRYTRPRVFGRRASGAPLPLKGSR